MLAEQRFDRARLAAIDRAVNQAVAARKLPGAVFRLEREGAVYERGYGKTSYEADAVPVSPDTIFDAASLTKVIATAPSVLMLAEEGRLDLDAPLVRYFPECAGGGKDAVTVRHLLSHTSGLPAGLPAKPDWRGDEHAHALACAQQTTHPTWRRDGCCRAWCTTRPCAAWAAWPVRPACSRARATSRASRACC